MRKEWNGLLVGKDEYEEKHPQLEPFNKVADPQALKNARPETDLVNQRNLLKIYIQVMRLPFIVGVVFKT